MSINAPLIESMMEDVILMDHISIPDGLGGFTYEWREGAAFKAAIVKNSTLSARVAEKQGVTEVYTVTIPSGLPVGFHDVIKRLSDGATFRITSNLIDSEAPKVATFSFGNLTAEKWDLV